MSSSIIFSGNISEADFIRTFLQGHGIPAWLEDENIGTLAPHYASAGGVQAVKVVISPADVVIATELLKEAKGKKIKDDWICPECEESIESQFSDCWQCGATRAD